MLQAEVRTRKTCASMGERRSPEGRAKKRKDESKRKEV
jgi:hypothetical protein